MSFVSSSEELKAWEAGEDNFQRKRNGVQVADKGNEEIMAWSNFDSLSKPARYLHRSRQASIPTRDLHLRKSRRRKSDPISTQRHATAASYALSQSAPSKSKEGPTDDVWTRVSKYSFIEQERGDEEEALFEERSSAQEGKHSRSPAVDPQRERELFAVYFDEGTTEGINGRGVGSKMKKVNRTSVIFNCISSLPKATNGTMAWLPGAIEEYLPLPFFFSFLEWNLRSAGKVYFCNSPISGLLILVGLFIQSARTATFGLVGLLTGNAVALGLRFNRTLISSGLFGYNSILCGPAVGTFKNSG